MNKKFRILISLVICIAMVFSLSACKKASVEPVAPAPTAPAGEVASSGGTYLDTLTAPPSKKAISIGTGSSSGAWYIIGGGMSNAINMSSDWFTITNEAASGGGENLRNLQDGNIEIAMLNCDMGYYFYTSTDSYIGAGDDSLRSLIAMPSSAMHIVVKAGSGIESIEDMRGKNVAVGTAGSGYESFANKVITSAGMTYDDMKVQMINPSQMADAMKDGLIDAFFFPVQAPGSAITELALNNDVEILSLSSDSSDKFLSEYIGYVNYTIPAGTYSGQDEAITTLATGQFVSTLRDSMSEDEVYVLLRDIFDNRDEWVVSHVSCKQITDDNIASLIVPLHAGAVKFYKERGVEIPEELIPAEAK